MSRSSRPDGTPVPILMYHAVADAPARAALRLSVTPAAFAEQMALLAARRFTPVTARQLAAAWQQGLPLPDRPVLITFDDGYRGVHHNALPVLTDHGFAATLFAATGWIRGRTPTDSTPGALDAMLDWGQIRQLAAAGVEIGGHSHSHPQLDQLSEEHLWFEILRCKEILADELGIPPVSFAYPYGYSSRRVRATVRAAGFTVSLAVGNALAERRQGRYALRRVTVRRSTDIEQFEQMVDGQAVGRLFAADRALTKGYAVVRGTRRALRKVRTSGG